MATIEPATIADSARANVQASTKMLAEWLAIYHPGDVVFHQLRLGATETRTLNAPLEPALERMLRRFNRYADAVIVTFDSILVVEAKLVASETALSQVRVYAKLAVSTPELQPYMPRKIIPVVVFGTFDPLVMQEARELGVEWIVYSPNWIGDYLQNSYYRARNRVAT